MRGCNRYYTVAYTGRKFLADGEGYASAVGDEMAMHTVQNRTGTVSPGVISIGVLDELGR